MKKFVFAALTLILIIGLVFTGCASSPTTTGAPSSSQAAAKEPVKVGFISSFTGNVGVNGPSQKSAFQLAVKQLNAKGGILGGRQIQDLYYDDGTQPEQAKTAATKAVVQDKVKIVIGSFLDGCSVAIRDVCAQSNIPFVSAIAGPPITWMDDYPYNVNMGAGAGPQWASAKTAIESRGYKTAAIVHGDSGWTQILKTMSENDWNAPGSPVKLVAEVMHPLGGASDLKTEYTKALASNPDALWISEWMSADTIAAIKAVYALGYKGFIVGPQPLSDPDLVAGLGSMGNGILYVGANFLPGTNDQVDVDFVKAWAAANNNEVPNETAGMAYDAAMAGLLGLDKAGTDSDPAKITDAITHLDYITVSGAAKLKFDSKYNDIIRDRMYSAVVKDGKLTDVKLYTIDGAKTQQGDIDFFGKLMAK